MDVPKESKFTASLSVAVLPASDTTPLRVSLKLVHAKIASDPKHEHLTAVPLGTGSANCYLQIWELDRYDQSRDVYMEKEETDRGKRENRLLASFPGAVVQNAAGRYEFQVIGDPTMTQDKVDGMNGKVLLELRSPDRTELVTHTVPMTDFESFFELAAVLRLEADNDAYASFDKAQPFLVQNLEASLRRQLEERGGISVGFVTNYKPGTKDYAGGEFVDQAEQMLATLPIFNVTGGKVTMGPYLIDSRLDVAEKLDEVRKAVQKLLRFKDPPRVSTLAFYGHGMPYGMQLDPDSWNASTSLRCRRVPPRKGDSESVTGFVAAIKDHAAPNLVIALFACSTGRGQPYPPKKGTLKADPGYGSPLPCEELGGDSLAWTLCRELSRQGISCPTVWAHTNAGHTTRNPRLRVFSTVGSADLVNLLVKMPSPDRKTIANYIHRFSDTQPKAKASTKRDWIHRANLIRAVSEVSAMYLPWAWSGREDLDGATYGYNEQAKNQAKAVYDEIRAEVADPTAVPDSLVYEASNRLYLTGATGGHDDPQLTEDYTLKQIVSGVPRYRVSVRLIGYLQMLLNRARPLLAVKNKPNRKLVVREILEGGDGLSLRLEPDDDKAREEVLAIAVAMRDEGLFTAAHARDNGLHISVLVLWSGCDFGLGHFTLLS